MYLADFYSTWTSPERIVADGYGGACYYLSHQPGKNAVKAAVLAARATGLVIQLNFEDAATNAAGGYSQGQSDAAFARGEALALGYPAGCVLPFAVDFDVPPALYGTIVAYMRGVLAECGPYYGTDYGSFSIVELVHAELGLVGWQTSAWSDGQRSAYAYAIQDEFGIEFDTSALEFNVPLWGLALDPAKPAPPAPKPKPAVAAPAAAPEEDDMATPIVVVATGESAGHLGGQIKAGETWILNTDGTRTQQSLAGAVATANFYKQLPLPGRDGCETRSCADIAEYPLKVSG